MRKELQQLYDYLIQNSPQFVEIVKETENMSYQEIAEYYNIEAEFIKE